MYKSEIKKTMPSSGDEPDFEAELKAKYRKTLKFYRGKREKKTSKMFVQFECVFLEIGIKLFAFPPH